MAKSTAVATKTKLGVNSWQEELAAAAKEVLESEKGAGGNFLKINNGKLSYQGQEFPGNKVQVIILDSVFANLYYDRPYDADSLVAPVCYAYARTEEALEPHAECAHAQSPQCKGCKLNAFGTSTSGKGKACSNTRRLLLLTPDMLEDMDTAQPLIFKLSPTNTRSWGGYAQQLAGVFKRPPFSVITEISVAPDSKTIYHVNFTKLAHIDDGSHLSALKAKLTQTREMEMLTQPYEVIEEAPAPPPTKKFAKR